MNIDKKKISAIKSKLQKYSQNYYILNHLAASRIITTVSACEMFGCYRLSERIRELEEHGCIISHVKRPKERMTTYKLIGVK
jgi:hypothetical protein